MDDQPLRDSYDLVVVGSGNAGLTAGITAALDGLDVVVIEKGELFGGSSALSGGAIWIPDNHANRRGGLEDSIEEADRYLEHLTGEIVDEARRHAYLREGPKMLAFLEERTKHIRYHYTPGYPDYHPEAPGGKAEGRSAIPKAIDSKKLGRLWRKLNRSDVLQPPGGLWLRPSEYREMLLLTRTWKGRRTAFKVGARTALARLAGRSIVSSGAAGIVRLTLAARDLDIPLLLGTPLVELHRTAGRVDSVTVEHRGETRRIGARLGVILAAGGFDHNDAMRQLHQEHPISGSWSSGAKTNTGDAILAGQALGAGVDLMDRAWWGPSVLAGDRALFFLSERSLPGSIMVDGDAHRFCNESAPYVDAVDAMYAHHRTTGRGIPAHLIFDQRFRDRYPFIRIPPRAPLPKAWYEQGWVVRADSLAELATKIGLDPDALDKTVDRFNDFARTGVDEDFGRGESAYDNYYADPTIEPNPNLGPIDRGPFYALRIVPGDLGTCGGLTTDEHARVVESDGTVIEGLYAAGNSAATVMGEQYAGPGATLGPAMVFGYIAARHANRNRTAP